MADLCDQASAREELVRNQSIQSIRASMLETEAGTDECSDCGDEIPLERRQVWPNATRCVWCQSQAERPFR